MQHGLWWKTWVCMGLLNMLVWGQTGCIAVLSSQVRQYADRTIAFEHLRAMPEAAIGRTLILGGEIIRVWNVPGATWFDVAHRPLDAQDQPILTAWSEGHFVVRCDRYLNPLHYTAGRVLTIARRVLGTHRCIRLWSGGGSGIRGICTRGIGTPGRGGHITITGGAGTIITARSTGRIAAGERREITRPFHNRCRYVQLDIW